MAEAKKTRTRSTKSAPKSDLVDLAAEPVVEAAEIVQTAEPTPAPKPSAPSKAAPKATSQESEIFTFPISDQGEALREAVREAVAVSAQGALEINDKIIQALQTQGHAALDLWRMAVDNSRRPDGFNVQTGAARQAFETASAQWKDVAEATARWMQKSAEPFQSALLR